MVLSELQESVQRMLELLQDVMVSTAQEKLNEAQEVVTKLEAEVKQLKKKDGELKELINCQDSIYFLKVRSDGFIRFGGVGFPKLTADVTEST